MRDKDLLKLLLQNRWHVVHISGSHHKLRKENATEIIHIHGRDVPSGLLSAILKRTGLK
ncbi:type II toxin-antitoxin system HicA family toxin [Selenomonas noxia]|uniref:type II toxin-antitoxin system HicA family toxin n=1 Tax=Selenomonas noxia TaxID=135083 RepID=UPI0023F3977E|nr:type II toxin-antitoxin system HicA family toxin [Selenomonas noxia]